MLKTILGVFSIILLLGFIFISCQKEDTVSQQSIKQQNTAKALTLNVPTTRCRIPLDSAVLYTKAFRTKMEQQEHKQLGEYTISYNIPADGLLDLFNEAENQHVKLKSIRAYRAIRNGQETVVYVGVDENDNDILPDNTNEANSHVITLPTEDYGNNCPPACGGNINVLNNYNRAN